MRRNDQAGFTLVELMVVVGLVGALAAVTIPMFMGSAKKAKTEDVKAELMKMALAAKTAYLNDGTFPQGSAAVLPAADGGACRYQDRKIPVSPAWGDDAIWKDLDVQVSEPSAYSFHYTSTSANTATLTAVADLNCDGILTTYTIIVADGVYDVASLDHPTTTTVAIGEGGEDEGESVGMSLPPSMELP